MISLFVKGILLAKSCCLSDLGSSRRICISSETFFFVFVFIYFYPEIFLNIKYHIVQKIRIIINKLFFDVFVQ